MFVYSGRNTVDSIAAMPKATKISRREPEALKLTEDANNSSRIPISRSPSQPPRIVSLTKTLVPSTRGELSPSIDGDSTTTVPPTPPRKNTPVPQSAQLFSEKEVLPIGSSSPQRPVQASPNLAAGLTTARRVSLHHAKSSHDTESLGTSSHETVVRSDDGSLEGDYKALIAAAQQARLKRPSLVMHDTKSFLANRDVICHSDSQLHLDMSGHILAEAVPNDKLVSVSTARDGVNGSVQRSKTVASHPTHFKIDKGTGDIPLKTINNLGPDLERLRRQQGGLSTSIVEDSVSPKKNCFEGHAAGEIEALRTRPVEHSHTMVSPVMQDSYQAAHRRLPPLPAPTPSPRQSALLDAEWNSSIPNSTAFKDSLHPRFNSVVSADPSLNSLGVGSPRSLALRQQHSANACLPSNSEAQVEVFPACSSVDNTVLDWVEKDIEPVRDDPIMADGLGHGGLRRAPSPLTALRSHQPDLTMIPKRASTLPTRRRETIFALPMHVDTARAGTWRGSVAVSTPYPKDEIRGKFRKHSEDKISDRIQNYGWWERIGAARHQKSEARGKSVHSLHPASSAVTTKNHSPRSRGKNRAPSLSYRANSESPNITPVFVTVVTRNYTGSTRSIRIEVPAPSSSRPSPPDDETFARVILAAYFSLRGYWHAHLSARSISGLRVPSSRSLYSDATTTRRQSVDEYMDINDYTASSNNAGKTPSVITTHQMAAVLLSPNKGRNKTSWVHWARTPSIAHKEHSYNYTRAAGSTAWVPAEQHLQTNDGPFTPPPHPTSPEQEQRQDQEYEQERSIEILSAPSAYKIGSALMAVLLLSIAVALLWIFLDVGGETVSMLGADGGAGGRVPGGVALGVWVLLAGWGLVGMWVSMGWVVG